MEKLLEQLPTIITNLLTTGGVGLFLFYVFRGLKQEIKTLNKTVETQKQTLDVMERRAEETERLSNMYKTLIDDFPQVINKYRTILNETQDYVIQEMKKASDFKDEQLKHVKEYEYSQVTNQKEALNAVTYRRKYLINAFDSLREATEEMIESEDFEFVNEKAKGIAISLPENSEKKTVLLDLPSVNRFLREQVLSGKFQPAELEGMGVTLIEGEPVMLLSPSDQAESEPNTNEG